VLQTSDASSPRENWMMREKAPVDRDYEFPLQGAAGGMATLRATVAKSFSFGPIRGIASESFRVRFSQAARNL